MKKYLLELRCAFFRCRGPRCAPLRIPGRAGSLCGEILVGDTTAYLYPFRWELLESEILYYKLEKPS